MADVRGDQLELQVEGVAFTGWQDVQITRSIEAASGAFTVSMDVRRPLPIRRGDRVTVKLSGELVIEGYVDTVRLEGSESSSRMSVSGRDKTSDLVDCSDVSEPGEWLDIELAALCQLVADPFGIDVRPRYGLGIAPFKRFARQPGESAWSAIERACRLRGILAHSAGDGTLLLERPGSDRAAGSLEEGRNLLAWSVQSSNAQRFQTYFVRAQHPGSDEFFGDQVALIQGEATDPGVTRYRPLLILAEGALVFEGAQDRARWEATVRAARSAPVSASVQGWRQVPDGPLWIPNQLCDVSIQRAGFEQELLVAEVTHSRSLESGEVTEITLVRADAYDPQPVVDEEEEPSFGF